MQQFIPHIVAILLLLWVMLWAFRRAGVWNRSASDRPLFEPAVHGDYRLNATHQISVLGREFVLDYKKFRGERTVRKIVVRAVLVKFDRYSQTAFKPAYLYAWCADRGDFRHFKVKNIHSLTDMETGEIISEGLRIVEVVSEMISDALKLRGVEVQMTIEQVAA